MSKSSDEKLIYLKNAGKEIYIESHLPPRQRSLPHMVYSIAAQMVDPGTWKSTQGKVLDRAQFKRLRVTSEYSTLRSHPERCPRSRRDHSCAAAPWQGELARSSLRLSLSVEWSGWLIAKSQAKLEVRVRLLTPETFFFLGKLVLEEPPAICALITSSVFVSKLICISAHHVTVFLCGFSDSRLQLEKFLD